MIIYRKIYDPGFFPPHEFRKLQQLRKNVTPLLKAVRTILNISAREGIAV